MTGQKTCRVHGGAASRARAAAAERRLDAQVRRELAGLDIEAVADPLTELGKVAGQILAFRDQVAAHVNRLGDQLRYEATGAGTEQLRAEVALWERALDRCVGVLATMAKLDIDSRLARISEAQAHAIIRALDAGLAAVGVTGERAQVARQAAARELRSVS